MGRVELTFVVPTIGRPTLARTLDSFVAQTRGGWSAVVVWDGLRVPPVARADQRILLIPAGAKLGAGNQSGAVRNLGIAAAPGEWLGFVDDDDRVDPRYAEWLHEEAEGRDLVVFGMRYPDGRVLPVNGELVPGGVGISFAVRAAFLARTGLRFRTEALEDFRFLDGCRQAGAVVAVSRRTAYYIRH